MRSYRKKSSKKYTPAAEYVASTTRQFKNAQITDNRSESTVQRQIFVKPKKDEIRASSIGEIIEARGGEVSEEEREQLIHFDRDNQQHIFKLKNNGSISDKNWAQTIHMEQAQKRVPAQQAWNELMGTGNRLEAIQAIVNIYGINSSGICEFDVRPVGNNNATTAWRDRGTGRIVEPTAENNYLGIFLNPAYLDQQFREGFDGFNRVVHTLRHEFKHAQQDHAERYSSREMSPHAKEFEAYAAEILDDGEYDLTPLEKNRQLKQAGKAIEHYSQLKGRESINFKAKFLELIQHLRHYIESGEFNPSDHFIK